MAARECRYFRHCNNEGMIVATKTVAIDIGATMVRLAEVELSSGADPRDGATLHAYAERPTPAGVLRDGVIEEPAALGAGGGTTRGACW